MIRTTAILTGTATLLVGAWLGFVSQHELVAWALLPIGIACLIGARFIEQTQDRRDEKSDVATRTGAFLQKWLDEGRRVRGTGGTLPHLRGVDLFDRVLEDLPDDIDGSVRAFVLSSVANCREVDATLGVNAFVEHLKGELKRLRAR